MDYGLLKKYTNELKVLFVEDDTTFNKEFSELLRDIFLNGIDIAYNGQEGLTQYEKYYNSTDQYYDLIITDIKMPKLDGVKFIEEVYKIKSEQKVIVLSARNEFNYLLLLLNMGVEHFFPKPIEYDKFLNELYKICEKTYKLKEKKCYKNTILFDDDIYWHMENKELYANNKLVKLTKLEIILLSKLTEDNARLFTIEELFTSIWGSPYEKKATMDNLKNIISRLRKKVPELKIDNIYGMGYKLQTK